MKTILRIAALAAGCGVVAVLGSDSSLQSAAQVWRAERRIVDLHQHVDYRPEHLERCLRIMDASGIGLVVNLSGGLVTHPEGKTSEFERNKAAADSRFPGRFLHYMSLDYSGWDDPGFSDRAVQQIEEGHRLGAAGFKEYKRLGLYLKDKAGKLIRIDDPRLDPVWRRCGQLGMPVSIHVADPQAFWKPYDASNERWRELRDHPQWWFGDPARYPAFMDLIEALDRVIGRHPETTFVCVHFANNSEDIDWVESALDRHPNMVADLAARIPEIGRHHPDRVRQLFIKHADRILFGTDFMVYDRLTLGSGGSGPAPTDADALEFYAKHWRWLETNDRQFEHMTPIQGDWRIDAIGLPESVLRKIYFDNARRLLARSWPAPTVRAVRVRRDFKPNGRLNEAEWASAPPARIEYSLKAAMALPDLASTARLLWSDRYLYVGIQAPYSHLTTFGKPAKGEERMGLWERDVVEVFVGTDPDQARQYAEFEVAPTGETLDVRVDLPEKDFGWRSDFEAMSRLDDSARLWTTELRIPLERIASTPPRPGAPWRLNLYRHDAASGQFLAWNPTATGSAHTPERFGILEFAE